MSKESFGKKIRENIQASIERAELERKRELFKRRIELARMGLEKYEHRKVAEAAQAFHTYLQVLEEWKKVPHGGLTPTLFDKEKDIHELLLISGVYWDLMKLYDRTQSPEKIKEFYHYMNQFVAFTKGMPYEHVCAETLRKYIACDKPIHSKDFKSAYQRITGSKCFVVTSLIDIIEPQVLINYRNFRDEKLKKTPVGRVFIWLYYLCGPSISWILDRMPLFVRRKIANILALFSKKIAN